MALQHHLPTEHTGITPVLSMPKQIADYSSRRSARAGIVCRRNQSSQKGSYPQSFEEAATDPENVGILRLAAFPEVQAVQSPRGNCRKSLLTVVEPFPYRIGQL